MAGAAKQKGVRATHPDYDAMCAKWERCRDVAKGRDAILAAGEKYLPKLRDQQPKSYDAYKKRASWYNASWRTIAGLKGMLFRKPVKVEVPDGLLPLLADVDMRGTPLHLFAERLAEEVLTVDRVGVLVDFPPPKPVEEGAELTQAQAEAEGLRPSLARYRTECIRNWRHRRVANRWVLSMVVLMEEARIPSGEFDETCEKRYRVLDLEPKTGFYRQRVFRINDRDEDEQVGADVFPLMNAAPMTIIPLVVIGSSGLSITPEEPSLVDLFDLNLDHYRVSADYERACHILATPTPWIAGWTPEVDKLGRPKQTLYMGGDAAWTFPNPQARAEFLEFQGSGVQELRENMKSKEARMAILGARMLEEAKRDAEAADTAQLHRAGEGSILAAIAQALSLGLTQALGWFRDWASQAGDVKVEVNRDFGIAKMDGTTLQSLLGAWQSGAISYETLFNRLQEGEVIDEEVTPEEEQARIAEFTPPIPGGDHPLSPPEPEPKKEGPPK